MKKFPFILALALCSCSANRSASDAAKQAVQLTPQQIQEAWILAGTPSANHKVLDPLVGKWTARITYWPAPGAPAQTSEGTAEARWILDGRFMQHDFHGMSAGRPFTGLWLLGFDNTRQLYVSSWADSLSTALLTGTGTYNPQTQTLTVLGSHTDPATKQVKKTRSVTRIMGPSQYAFEMYEEFGPQEHKSVEIIFQKQVSKPVRRGKRRRR